jgi:formate transporter
LNLIVQPPAALYQGAVAAGAAKATAPWKKIFTLGIVSGCHIAFGAYLAITVGGACPGIAAENPGLQKVRFDNEEKRLYTTLMTSISFVVAIYR